MWFTNGLVGNPVSRYLAKKTAQNRISEVYKDTDFTLEEVHYSFKDGCYYAAVSSPSSKDSGFVMILDWRGNLNYDNYEERVLHRGNTADRLNQEYRVLTDKVFKSSSFPYSGDIQYGSLLMNREEYLKDPDITDIPSCSMTAEELELDKVYDISKLGSQCGELTIHVESEDVTPELAAQIALDIKRQMDDAGIGFRLLDFKLKRPLQEDGTYPDVWIGFENFSYEDINEEGMVERVIAADGALKEKYEKLDAIKNQETENE